MISKEKKAAIMAEYGGTPNDTGSPEVQIAILTARIQELTEHLKEEDFLKWLVRDVVYWHISREKIWKDTVL